MEYDAGLVIPVCRIKCGSHTWSRHLVDGTFAAGVAGAGAYAFINDLLYVELTGYRTVNFDTLNKLGQDPFGFPGTIDGIAPYWRVAVEPHWGNHWLEFGAFGMSAQVHPWTFATIQTASTLIKRTRRPIDTRTLPSMHSINIKEVIIG